MTDRRPVLRLVGDTAVRRPDTLAVEEPLEIRVDGVPVAVTMRTPGADFDLAVGFLVTEGALGSPSELASIRYCADLSTLNVVDVGRADPAAPLPPSLARTVFTSSSCGVCGKASIDAVRLVSRWSVRDDQVVVRRSVLAGLPERLRAAQPVFDRTGGLHAAGLFTPTGERLCVREDVGRHNAVDKVLGWALREDRLPLRGTLLAVSGRASFELVQKAAMAGVPVLAAVSAPSSLAAALAAEAGLTLAGFVRGEAMNVYAGEARVLR